MATLDDLLRLAPPPATPIDAAGDWPAVEAALGLVLPADYKEMISRYGAGRFHDISPLTPFDSLGEGTAALVAVAKNLLGLHGPFREEYPEHFSCALYPEADGLLPWAMDGNGAQMCWLTTGEPDRWTVVVWSPDGEVDRHDLNATGFLVAYLTGRIRYPRPPRTPYFEPSRERVHVYVGLTDGDLPYEQRLEILRERLAPTADRGAFSSPDGHRQDHFKALEHDWLLTYENAYGHQIRVAFPPEDAAKARAVILEAARGMGCEVLRTTSHRGEPVAWV